MSGVRGDARRHQSQPAPEVRMTEAERMAYLAGYEFALSHIHDEPVQADLALLSSDTTEAPGVRAVIEREVAKEREKHAAELAEAWKVGAARRDEGRRHYLEVTDLRERIGALADEWDRNAGPDSDAHRVLGAQKLSVEFAVASLRALVTAADVEAGQ